jgi:hypothetical protein
MKKKQCIQCNKIKDITEFYFRKDNNTYRNECISCQNKRNSVWKKEHPERIRELSQQHHKENPGKRIVRAIKYRCENPKCDHYKYYGGRGIKCDITVSEVNKLYIRDNAKDMKRPSIDRKNNDGDYCYDNCQFLEYEENFLKSRKKQIIQLSKIGTEIKIWDSIMNASRKLKIEHTNIISVAKGKRTFASGYRWKYVD